MASVVCGSRTWTDAISTPAARTTVTVARPSKGVLYLRIIRSGVAADEVKTWASTGAATVSRVAQAGDAVRIWVGASTSQTVTVTTVVG